MGRDGGLSHSDLRRRCEKEFGIRIPRFFCSIAQRVGGQALLPCGITQKPAGGARVWQTDEPGTVVNRFYHLLYG